MKPGKIIEQIREEEPDVKIKIQHRRPIVGLEKVKVTKWELEEQLQDSFGGRGSLSQFGGETIVKFIFPSGKTYTGVAECSKKDRFNKKIGLNIALGRALKKIADGESDKEV